MRFLTAWNKSEDLVGPDSLTPYKLHRIYKLNSRLTQICIKMAPLFPPFAVCTCIHVNRLVYSLNGINSICLDISQRKYGYLFKLLSDIFSSEHLYLNTSIPKYT